MNSDEQMIAAVLSRYESAANAGDVAAIADLYAPDAVLMAENSPSVVGANAIREAYAGMMTVIGLNITFVIAEIRHVAPDWAFLRSTSTGTIKLKANGADLPESNQELFVFQKVGGAWKIARYSFSTTLPAQA